MELIHGRPENCADRLPKEMRTYDLLDDLGVDYYRIDHQAAMTMEDCVEIDRKLDAVICKNLLLCNRQETSFYLLMIPGEKPFKTKYLSKQIGSARLSFAAPEYMEQFLDITPGSLSVLGLMNDKDQQVTLLMDKELLNEEYIGVHPCVNTSSLRMRVQDLIDVFLPAVGHDYVTVHLTGGEA
jgi:Ala-tRNA(Pro) deacylase